MLLLTVFIPPSCLHLYLTIILYWILLQQHSGEQLSGEQLQSARTPSPTQAMTHVCFCTQRETVQKAHQHIQQSLLSLGYLVLEKGCQKASHTTPVTLSPISTIPLTISSGLDWGHYRHLHWPFRVTFKSVSVPLSVLVFLWSLIWTLYPTTVQTINHHGRSSSLFSGEVIVVSFV